MAKWIHDKAEANISLMSETLNISQTLSQIMVNRGVRTKNTAINFLSPKLQKFHDFNLMKGMKEGISIVSKAIENGDKIAVYGDYDVDGVTSVTILYKTLKKFGANVMYHIPDREKDGYGLNKDAIKYLKSLDVNVLVTCDNGIASIDEVSLARELELEVVIIDHHMPAFKTDENSNTVDVLPNASAIINPKQADCNYPFKMLCAAGITFKFCMALHSHYDVPFEDMDEFLVFAMFATFCDIVDLQDENRIIATYGLKILNENKNVNKGIYALLKAKSYLDREINSFSIGFVIGPCINASGRLDSALEAVSLFVSEDEEKINEIATNLAALNELRKEMTNHYFEQAKLLVENTDLVNHKVLVVLLPDAHESIAGIVAGRIKEKFHKPTIVLTKSKDFIKGSARSVEGFNIFEAMFNCKDLFLRFGGHPMAAGVSLVAENVSEMRKRLNDECTLTEEEFVEKIHYDEEILIDDITFDLAEEISFLAPFGKANKEPIFRTNNLKPFQIKFYKEKNTIIFSFSSEKSNRKIKAVSFGLFEKFEKEIGILENSNFLLDIIYSIEINVYNGDTSVQMKIKDFKRV